MVVFQRVRGVWALSLVLGLACSDDPAVTMQMETPAGDGSAGAVGAPGGVPTSDPATASGAGSGGATASAGDGTGTGEPASAGGGAGAAGEPAAGEPAADPEAVPADLVDPGADPWEVVPGGQIAEVCRLDPDLLTQADLQLNVPWAVVRYGRLCHEYYPPGQSATTEGEVFSTTKSLGATVVGMVSYQTRDLERTGPKTGPLSDWDRADHWLDSFTYNADAHVAHVLAMVAHNADLSWGQKPHAYDTVGDIEINSLSDMANAALAQDPERLGANLEEFTQRFLYAPLGMTHSSWTADAPDKIFAYTWSSTVRDMARLGLLVLNRGVWNGERLMSEEWVYKMTHPAFEDGNTAYGYLTWLSAHSNHSIGFSPPTAQGPSVPCAPAALWNAYPHGMLSEATDCNYEPPETCEQQYDVGVWQAVGFMGMVIQGHPGLDMVLVVKNDALGGAGLWPAVLPAVVAMDPDFAGDQDAFCRAYTDNDHAPDYRPWTVYQ